MKTITEMQQEIKNISSSLEELSKDIMEFEKKDGNKPSEDLFKKIKTNGKRNPILEHPLENKDDIIKKHYITLLVSAIYTTTQNTIDAWLLAQRIACGVSLAQEISEISLDASSLTEKQLEEYTYSIIENKLEEIFSFDLLMLYAVCNSSDSKMLAYIVDLIALVNCSKKKLSELSALAEIVVRQDSNKYLDFCTVDTDIDITQFFCYIKQFHDGLLACNEKVFYIWHKNKKQISNDVFLKLPEEINSNIVCIENTLFKNIDKNMNFLNFGGNGEIKIKECKFSNIEKALTVSGANALYVEHTEFNKMTNRALDINNSKEVKIINSQFTECEYCVFKYIYYAYGGALYLSNIENLVIDHSIFESCRALNVGGGRACGPVAYLCKVERGIIDSIKCKNCDTKNYGQLIECYNSDNVKAKNCTYTNCNKLSGMDGFTQY